MNRRRLLAVLAAGGVSGCLRLEGDETTVSTGTTGAARATTSTTGGGTEAQASATTTEETATEESTTEETEADDEPPKLAESDALERRWMGPEHVSGLGLHGDDVLVEDSSTGIVALDRGQGFERWQPYADGSAYDFVVDNDDLFVGTSDGDVVAVDLSSRSTRWRYEGTDLHPAIRVGSSSVVFGKKSDDGGAVVCVERATGDVRWRHETANWVSELSPPDSGTVVFGTTGEANVQGHDVETGSKRWLFEDRHPAITPLVRDGRAYVAVYRRVIAFDADSGEIRWEYSLPDDQDRFDGRSPGHPPVLANGLLYVPIDKGGVVALDPETGEEAWLYAARNTENAIIDVDDGEVWLADQDSVHRMDAETGEGALVGRVPYAITSVSGFAVDDGRMFLVPALEAVRAFDVVA